MRPELGDLLTIVDGNDVLGSEWWPELAERTEAAWVRRMLDGEEAAEERGTPTRRLLVVRPNLDLHTGTTGVYRRRHGNLRRDGAREVLERAFAGEPVSRERL